MTFKPQVFWLFGLSGAGKSTLAGLLAADLRARGVPVLSLDGDVMRAGLCLGLGFSEADRTENLRRSAEAARIGVVSHLTVVAAFITPLEAHRQLITRIVGNDLLSLIWIDAPLDTCQARDVKGLYARAKAGQEKQMTGLGSRFEPPHQPVLTLETATQSAEASATRLRDFALRKLEV